MASKMEAFINTLPGGPSSIHVFGKLLFPPTSDLNTIEKAAAEGLFPTFAAIFYPALFYAIVFGIMRLVLTKLIFRPLAIYSRQLPDVPKVPVDPVIEKLLVQAAITRSKEDRKRERAEAAKAKDSNAAIAKTYSEKQLGSKIDDSRPTNAEVKRFCQENASYDEDTVNNYLWRMRRFNNAELKITKFVEAFWRFLFYFSFAIMGYVALFRSPTRMFWIDDTISVWKGWPFIKPEEQLSGIIKLYYQVQLGCYMHQLYWTEVDRKDATEMIIHHCSTILLITWSWCCNFTRLGSITLLVHDVADVFLESAKCVNYASISKGRKWMCSICDTLFAHFALIFAVSRLYYLPRYVVYSMVFINPVVFESRAWPGYWLFSFLICVLQVLHIFWFYLIMKMVWGLIKKGKVEGDVRSDDEGDEEQERVKPGAELSKVVADKDARD